MSMGYLKGFGGVQKKITRGKQWSCILIIGETKHGQMGSLPNEEDQSPIVSQLRHEGRS